MSDLLLDMKKEFKKLSNNVKIPKEVERFYEWIDENGLVESHLRNRWKDSKGKIYEWDSQHGTVEVYDRSGRNHLGEFNHITGEQTKPADPTRKVEK